MNVPRFWRKNSQRYRLVGVQYQDGQKSIVNRPIMNHHANEVEKTETENQRSTTKVSAA